MFIDPARVTASSSFNVTGIDRLPAEGGFFEDETGWWMFDHADEDGTGAWFIGRDGDERFIEWRNIPRLTHHDRS